MRAVRDCPVYFHAELEEKASLVCAVSVVGEDSVQTVAVTQAVLQAIEERRSVAVPAVALHYQ